MGVRIRAATADDARVVATIYVESWNDGFGHLLGRRSLDDQLVKRWAHDLVTGPQRWWVAERAGQVIGFVGTGPSRDPVQPGLGELDTIAVAPAEWRTGVGRALMTVAVESLEEAFSEAILWTVAGYEQGQRFYEATGWTADGGTRQGGRHVSFRRSLSGPGDATP